MKFMILMSEGARAKLRDAAGRFSVTDGPFAEAESLDEAVAWAKRARFIAGANEVREIVSN